MSFSIFVSNYYSYVIVHMKTEGEFKASQKLFSVCVYVLFGWNRFSYAFKCIYCN